MRLTLSAILAFVALSSAAAIPDETSLNPAAVLNKRNSYNCKGSGLCGSTPVKYCDQAVNTLIRNGDLNYGAPGSGKALSGNCWANSDGYGCGIFIQGTDSGQGGAACVISGNQMWWDYQEIRNSGCRICGSKQYDSGCEVTINYVTGCDNRG